MEMKEYFDNIDYLYEPMKIINAKRTMPRNDEKKA